MRYNLSTKTKPLKEISHMLQKHITIEQLVCIQIYQKFKINAYQCSLIMGIGKDKVYRYYKLFKEGLKPLEIYQQYKVNKSKCGRKKKILSEGKLDIINELLDNDWSLDSICGRDYLLGTDERYCTKTLYRIVQDKIIDASKLRRKGKRKPNNHQETRGKINDCKTIHERNEKYPDTPESKEFGHFEGDTIIGEKRKSAIVTLVEKTSKYIVLLKASRKSQDVLEAMKSWFNSCEDGYVKTITFDRGKEFAKWKDMEALGKTEVYFSDPGSPGQRGLNENSNGIVRKDLPKSTDLSKHSQEELNKIADKWNSIPRKSLGYFTPKEKMEMAVGTANLLSTA